MFNFSIDKCEYRPHTNRSRAKGAFTNAEYGKIPVRPNEISEYDATGSDDNIARGGRQRNYCER